MAHKSKSCTTGSSADVAGGCSGEGSKVPLTYLARCES